MAIERISDNEENLNRPDANSVGIELNRLIEEAQEAIRNTRSFLEQLRPSEQGARELVDSLKQRLERDLRDLERRNAAELK